MHDLTIEGCGDCPVCNNQTLHDGEYVDVGVGHVQCSPDFCPTCGYAQPSPHRDEPYTYDQMRKLWEMQIDPWDRGEPAPTHAELGYAIGDVQRIVDARF